MADRVDTLSTVSSSWQELERAIAHVPHDRVDTPGVVGSWSVKDLIGHVATWDQEALQALRRYLSDRDAKALVTWPDDIDGFNAREADRKRGTDPAVLRRELAESHRQIVELISGLAEEELETREVKARIRRHLRALRGPRGTGPPLAGSARVAARRAIALRIPDSPPDMVGELLGVLSGVSGCRPGVTHDMIGHRTGSRVPSLRVSAAVRCQLWLFSGRRRHGPAWQLGRVAYKPMLQAGSPYVRYGSAASANILCRTLSSNSYEGWPRARRMINLRA